MCFLPIFTPISWPGTSSCRARVAPRSVSGAQAQADFAFTPFHDGETLTFGHVQLKILETPGHTPEAISILVYDLAQDPHQPYAVLTGDTLFIGDVGRPDLMASVGMYSGRTGRDAL